MHEYTIMMKITKHEGINDSNEQHFLGALPAVTEGSDDLLYGRHYDTLWKRLWPAQALLQAAASARRVAQRVAQHTSTARDGHVTISQ